MVFNEYYYFILVYYFYILLLYIIFIYKNIIRNAISIAKNAKVFGLILGTLGRQGSLDIFNRIKLLLEGTSTNLNCCSINKCDCYQDNNNNENQISMNNKNFNKKRIVIPFLMAELNPIKMAKITNVDVILIFVYILYIF